MSMKTKYILMIVTWLVVAGLIIIPRLIFKQPTLTDATNATKADIVNAIYSLQNTIYAAVWIGVCAIIAVLVLKYYAK